MVCISEHMTVQYTAMAVKFRLAGGSDVLEAPGWGVAALAWGLLVVSGGVLSPRPSRLCLATPWLVAGRCQSESWYLNEDPPHPCPITVLGVLSLAVRCWVAHWGAGHPQDPSADRMISQ